MLRAAFSRLHQVKANYTPVGISAMEDFIGRGDRRIGAVIKRAWELGATNDAWCDRCTRGLMLLPLHPAAAAAAVAPLVVLVEVAGAAAYMLPGWADLARKLLGLSGERGIPALRVWLQHIVLPQCVAGGRVRSSALMRGARPLLTVAWTGSIARWKVATGT
jgi:hypothetical protein